MAVADDLQPEPSPRRVLSVTDLTRLIKHSLQTAFGSVWVAGEISNLAQPRSGHMYMTLKDQGAQLRAVVWRNTAAQLKFNMQDGLEVLCHGDIDVYAPHGSYQLIVRHVEPRGEGALQLALRQLRARLGAEGLFAAEHKQRLPSFPRRIGLITSPTGAAIRDFLEVAGRRWQGVDILVIPVRVQGTEAIAEIAAAIETANRLVAPPDVLVLARGGGSLEDLWCFNEERVVRAIFQSTIPVVSAVGHEIDVTLADLVADVRALTPSEAAELVVPSRQQVTDGLGHLRQRMAAALQARSRQARAALEVLSQRPVLRRPHDRLHDLSRRLDDLEMRSSQAAKNLLVRTRDRVGALSGRLQTLSPLGVLARGYSLTTRADDGTVVRETTQLTRGDQIRTQLAHGRLVSRVEALDTQGPGDRNRHIGRIEGEDHGDQG